MSSNKKNQNKKKKQKKPQQQPQQEQTQNNNEPQSLPQFTDVQIEVKDRKTTHDFWDTQPVVYSLRDGFLSNKYIKYKKIYSKNYIFYKDPKSLINENSPCEVKTLEQVQKEPYELPSECVWFEPDLTDPQMVNFHFDCKRDL